MEIPLLILRCSPCAGLLDQGELLRKHIPGKTALIVTNETIAPLYLDRCVR